MYIQMRLRSEIRVLLSSQHFIPALDLYEDFDFCNALVNCFVTEKPAFIKKEIFEIRLPGRGIRTLKR